MPRRSGRRWEPVDRGPSNGARSPGLAERRYQMCAFLPAPLPIGILAATLAWVDHDSALAIGVAVGIVAAMALTDRHEPATHVHGKQDRHAPVHRHAHQHRGRCHRHGVYVHRHRGHGRRSPLHRHAHGHGQVHSPVHLPRLWYEPPLDWCVPSSRLGLTPGTPSCPSRTAILTPSLWSNPPVVVSASQSLFGFPALSGCPLNETALDPARGSSPSLANRRGTFLFPGRLATARHQPEPGHATDRKMTMLNRFVFAAAVALSLAACGGDGSGSGPQAASLAVVELPSSKGATWIDDWSPNYRFDELVHIGIGVAESILPVGVPRPRIYAPVYSKARHGVAPVWHENVRNGTSKRRLADFLEADAAEDDGRLRRFGDRPPVIRAVYGTSNDHWRALRFAVQVLNDNLPRNWQLRISDERASAPYVGSRPAKGEIVVHFERREFWPADTCSPSSVGCATTWRSDDEITRGIVRVDHSRRDLKELRSTILHELIHILGRNHPDPYDFPESAMRTPRTENNGLPPVPTRSRRAVCCLRQIGSRNAG